MECSFHCTENIGIYCTCPIHELERQLALRDKELAQVVVQLKEMTETAEGLKDEVVRLSGKTGYCLECERLSKELAIEHKEHEETKKTLWLACERMAEVNVTIATNPLTRDAYAMAIGEPRLTPKAWLDYLCQQAAKEM